MNGVELCGRLKATHETIADGHPNDSIDDLIPCALIPCQPVILVVD